MAYFRAIESWPLSALSARLVVAVLMRSRAFLGEMGSLGTGGTSLAEGVGGNLLDAMEEALVDTIESALPVATDKALVEVTTEAVSRSPSSM